MKKIYQIPTVTVTRVELVHMIANSSLETSDSPAAQKGGMLSRRRSFWDDEDTEE